MSKSITPVYIYELRDPRDGRTYYVGKSVQPRYRYTQHLHDADKRPDTPKGKWIKRLAGERAGPELHIVKKVTDEDWARAEAAAIQQHLDNGSPLTNVIVPSGRRRGARPRLNLRAQDYWDDLTVQFRDMQRRMYPFKHPEGYGLTVLANYQGRGWRHQYDKFANGLHVLLRDVGNPYAHGFPAGFPSLTAMAGSEDWYEQAILEYIFERDLYEQLTPVEDLAPEQLGYWPTGRYVVK